MVYACAQFRNGEGWAPCTRHEAVVKTWEQNCQRFDASSHGLASIATQLHSVRHNRPLQFLARGETNLFSIIQAAGWPIWPLIACSVLALALIIERFIALKRARVAPSALLNEAVSVSSRGMPTKDVVDQLAQNSVLGEVLATGLRTLQTHPQASEEELRAAIEGAGRSAAHQLEKYLSALGTIASAAPLLGLMGTVIGMIEIFGSQGGGQLSGGNPAQLAHGISIALYNTAFGLIVAIPALIFWRYFRTRVDGYLLEMELASEKFLRHLNKIRVQGLLG